MGLSMVALRNAGHIGRVGDWAEMAAEARASSPCISSTLPAACWWRPSAAPSAGCRPRRSASACRGPGQTPVVLDFATSIVAEGKVLVASQGGKKLPDNALIDLDGKMSADPHVLYGEYTATGLRDHGKGKGAIRAFGEHKGSGLALMCELLGGSLTGMKRDRAKARRFGNGMLSFYVDPKVVDPEAMFSDDVARYIAYFKSAKPATPGGEVLVPGEPEQRMRAQRSKEGVPLPDDTWASIVAAAREVGVDENRIQQATA